MGRLESKSAGGGIYELELVSKSRIVAGVDRAKTLSRVARVEVAARQGWLSGANSTVFGRSVLPLPSFFSRPRRA